MDTDMTSSVRIKHITLTLFVLSDWITDAVSIDFRILETENNLTEVLSMSSVIVGLVFTLILLGLHCFAIWTGYDDKDQELACLQLELLHAVFESLPEVIFRSISLANSEKNAETIASLLISISFILVIAAKFYFNQRDGEGEDMINVLQRGLEFGMVVTVVLVNINSYIAFSNRRVSARWILGWAILFLFFFVLLVVVLISAPALLFGDFERENKLYISFIWSLTLLSTAVMASMSIASGNNVVFVSLFTVAVMFYTFVVTGCFKPRSDKKKSITYALVTIAVFIVIVCFWCVFNQFIIPINVGWPLAFIVSFLVLSVIGTWFLRESQSIVSRQQD